METEYKTENRRKQHFGTKKKKKKKNPRKSLFLEYLEVKFIIDPLNTDPMLSMAPPH